MTPSPLEIAYSCGVIYHALLCVRQVHLYGWEFTPRVFGRMMVLITLWPLVQLWLLGRANKEQWTDG
jgi:heme A synthase